MRLFVAIDLPEDLKQRLAELVAELRACGADVRWVQQESMHLTLKFLGHVDEGELGNIDAALKRVADATPPTRGRLRDVGSFPHLSRPRVIWVGVETGGAELDDLHRELDAGLYEIGFAREKRGFRPHVTIGRVRRSRTLGGLQDVVMAHDGFDAGVFDVAELTLFQSELSPKGATYTALARHRLAG